MRRQHLVRKRQQLDQRLTAQQAVVAQRRDASLTALQRLPLMQVVAVGFVAGAVAGRLGWRRTYSIGRWGAQLYPLLQPGLLL